MLTKQDNFQVKICKTTKLKHAGKRLRSAGTTKIIKLYYYCNFPFIYCMVLVSTVFRKMAAFLQADDNICCSQDSIEVEIVSDEEFRVLDEAIQNAIMQEGISSG